MRTVASAESDRVAAALDELLTGRCGGSVGGDYFERDWSPLWRELVDGGWTGVGTELAESGGRAEALLDLIAIGEVWGRRLAPVPLMEAISLSLLDMTGDPDAPRLVLPDGAGGGLVPRELPGGANDAPTVDDFAPSLPLRQALRHDRVAGDLHPILVLWGAEAVGCAVAAFDRTIEYSRVRTAYGQPIGSFQAVKHLLADCLKEIELARSAVVWAAHDPERAALIVNDALARARSVLTDAIQVHGGVGFTWELGLHYHLRHVLGLQKVLRLSAGVGATR